MAKLFNRDIDTIISNHHDLNPEHLKSHPQGITEVEPLSNSSLLLQWLPKYGYSQFGGDVLGIVTGQTDVSQLLQSGGSILNNSFLNKTLNNNSVSTLIDTTLSIDELAIFSAPDRLPTQLLFSNILLGSTPLVNSETAQAMGLNLAADVVNTLKNSGITTDLLDNIIDDVAGDLLKTYLASDGLKYTQAVGWWDPTKKTWDKNYVTNITYNKWQSDLLGVGGYLDKLDKDSAGIYDEMMERLHYDDPSEQNETNDKVDFVDVNEYLNKKSYTAKHKKLDNKQKQKYQIYQNKNVEKIKDSITGLIPFYEADPLGSLDVGHDYTGIKDRIKFKFINEIDGTIIIFRAVIDGLDTSASSNWNSIKYSNNALDYYTYSGFTKSVSLSFTVYSQNVAEVTPNWNKLQYIEGFVEPAKSNTYLIPPLFRFTVGDYYNNVLTKLDSISITPHSDSMWELQEGIQLPMVVTVSMGLTLLNGDKVGNKFKLGNYSR